MSKVKSFAKVAALIDPSKFGPSSLATGLGKIWNGGLAKASKGAIGLAQNIAAPTQAATTAVKSFTPVAKIAPAMGFAGSGGGQAAFIAKKRGLLG